MDRIQQLLCPSQEGNTHIERRYDAKERLEAWSVQQDDRFLFFRVTAFREETMEDGTKIDTPEAIECRVSWTEMGLDAAFAAAGTGEETFRWTGRELDTETDMQYQHARFYDPTRGRLLETDPKLQYNRARSFDPAVGRWISENPLGYEEASVNLYRYPQEAQDAAPEEQDGTLPREPAS